MKRNESDSLPAKSFILPVILSLLPIIMVGAYIFRFGLNIPFWDQWSVVRLFIEKQQGSLTLADLFAQHNEHRPFFPNLIWITLAGFTRYNVNVELWVDLLITLGMFLFFIRRSMSTWDRSGIKRPLLLIPLLSLLVFNLGQYENWLQGVQISVGLPMACVVIGMFLLAENPKPPGFIAAILLGVIANFSNANGLFYWPAGLGVLVITVPQGSRSIKISVWLLCASVCIGLFLTGWRSAGLDFGYVFTHFADYLIFLLNFLGSPINATVVLAWMLGCVGAGLFIIILVHILINRSWKQSAPYFGIISFVLLTALSISAGRLGLGLEQARVSRYQSITIWYWACLLTLVPMLKFRNIYKNLFYATITVSLLLLMYMGYRNGQIGLYQRILPAYQAVLSGQEVSDEVLSRIYPRPDLIRPRLEYLCENKLSLCADLP